MIDRPQFVDISLSFPAHFDSDVTEIQHCEPSIYEHDDKLGSIADFSENERDFLPQMFLKSNCVSQIPCVARSFDFLARLLALRSSADSICSMDTK